MSRAVAAYCLHLQRCPILVGVYGLMLGPVIGEDALDIGENPTAPM